MTRRSTVLVPDPSLVVLVGAAGAGKSTLAARHFAPDEILSSDDLRGRIGRDASDQAATGPAFTALHRALSARLGAGRLTVVDATNVTRAARRALLRRAGVASVPAVAIVLDLPAAVVLERNAARVGRTVPSDVVRRQLRSLAGSLPGHRLASEGFAQVVHLEQPGEVDALRLVRQPAIAR